MAFSSETHPRVFGRISQVSGFWRLDPKGCPSREKVLDPLSISNPFQHLDPELFSRGVERVPKKPFYRLFMKSTLTSQDPLEGGTRKKRGPGLVQGTWKNSWDQHPKGLFFNTTLHQRMWSIQAAR